MTTNREKCDKTARDERRTVRPGLRRFAVAGTDAGSSERRGIPRNVFQNGRGFPAGPGRSRLSFAYEKGLVYRQTPPRKTNSRSCDFATSSSLTQTKARKKKILRNPVRTEHD